jgi:hypothetical protein
MNDLPFSLTCIDCDRGDGIDTLEQAMLSGWHAIREDDGMSWNYLGWCPECYLESTLSPKYLRRKS